VDARSQDLPERAEPSLAALAGFAAAGAPATATRGCTTRPGGPGSPAMQATQLRRSRLPALRPRLACPAGNPGPGLTPSRRRSHGLDYPRRGRPRAERRPRSRAGPARPEPPLLGKPARPFRDDRHAGRCAGPGQPGCPRSTRTSSRSARAWDPTGQTRPAGSWRGRGRARGSWPPARGPSGGPGSRCQHAASRAAMSTSAQPFSRKKPIWKRRHDR
jgi:hypothetical protein